MENKPFHYHITVESCFWKITVLKGSGCLPYSSPHSNMQLLLALLALRIPCGKTISPLRSLTAVFPYGGQLCLSVTCMASFCPWRDSLFWHLYLPTVFWEQWISFLLLSCPWPQAKVLVFSQKLTKAPGKILGAHTEWGYSCQWWGHGHSSHTKTVLVSWHLHDAVDPACTQESLRSFAHVCWS